ncbi:recombinase family protein [Candidatus Marinimicrobia bacterium MT.SAG.3]|nr:recombinase family protein [Candidatus Marinimicrobia bacterium MT.SAG.3]
MNIGYARVSTGEQNLDLQVDALKQADCKTILQEKISGTISERPKLEEALNFMRDGDTLVVWRLDRLGRSLKHLIEIINHLHDRGLYFKSLTENIDTVSSSGKLIFHIFGALAEFERNIISERTKAGLKAARARGRQGGRPRSIDDRTIEMAKRLINEGSNSISEICQNLGISRASLYRYLKE